MSRFVLLAALAAFFVAALFQSQAASAATPRAADIDRDGVVSILDITIVFDHADARSDVNSDGVADGFDVIAVLIQWNAGYGGWRAPTPAATVTATDVASTPTLVPPTPTRTPVVLVPATSTSTSTATATSTASVGAIVDTPTPTPTRTPILALATPTKTPLPPAATATSAPVSGTRDKFQQPFASTSIWNMPIGSSASYVPAGIKDWSTWGVFEEQNYIFNNPNAPVTPLRWSGDLWSGGSRCNPDNTASVPVATVPLPSSFILAGAGNGNTPNNAAALITQDGNNYVQTQPLTHCAADGPWTTGYVQQTVSIYGAGITGAQGGSHLSSIGGTIRVGEWQTAAQEGRFRHALKTVLNSSNYSSSTGPGCNAAGCRWPANSSDCGDTACGYAGNNAQVMMGTLLAVPPSYNCAGMQTEPGRIVCQTLKDYGMYIVDSGWDPAYLPAEHGPNGNAGDDFVAAFGYAMFSSNATTPWALDWRQLVTASQVIANNSADSIGGGGTPRVPMAPPIGN